MPMSKCGFPYAWAPATPGQSAGSPRTPPAGTLAYPGAECACDHLASARTGRPASQSRAADCRVPVARRDRREVRTDAGVHPGRRGPGPVDRLRGRRQPAAQPRCAAAAGDCHARIPRRGIRPPAAATPGESLVLSAAGSVAGIVVAHYTMRLLTRQLAPCQSCCPTCSGCPSTDACCCSTRPCVCCWQCWSASRR